MALDDVPPDEMLLSRSSSDALDAALRGEADDPAVEALVHDLRAAYLPEGPRPRSATLTAFAGTGDGVPVGTAPAGTPAGPTPASVAPIRRQVAVAAAAFAATLTGKVVLGGAVAAATLGGLHATEVVDVPLLPRAPQAQTVPSTVPEHVDLPDPVSALLGPATGLADVDVPPTGPAPAAPVAPSEPSRPGATPDAPADEPADAGPDSAPVPTPAPTPTPDEADPPVPPAADPDGEQPPTPAPGGDAPSTPPAGSDESTDPPAGPDPDPPAPATDDERAPTRP